MSDNLLCGNEKCLRSTRRAAKLGHFGCLKEAYKNRGKWSDGTADYAARNGFLPALRYLHENGCPMEEATWWAAKSGNIACLEYAHANGCELNKRVLLVAAEYGRVECLKYVLANGCEWNNHAPRFAACSRRLKVLVYIYEHCGDVATWENANLEMRFRDFCPEIQDFINNVREDWKAGLNKPGRDIKG